MLSLKNHKNLKKMKYLTNGPKALNFVKTGRYFLLFTLRTFGGRNEVPTMPNRSHREGKLL